MNDHSDIKVIFIIVNILMIVSALVITGLNWGYKPACMCIFCMTCALDGLKNYWEL